MVEILKNNKHEGFGNIKKKGLYKGLPPTDIILQRLTYIIIPLLSYYFIRNISISYIFSILRFKNYKDKDFYGIYDENDKQENNNRLISSYNYFCDKDDNDKSDNDNSENSIKNNINSEFYLSKLRDCDIEKSFLNYQNIKIVSSLKNIFKKSIHGKFNDIKDENDIDNAVNKINIFDLIKFILTPIITMGLVIINLFSNISVSNILSSSISFFIWLIWGIAIILYFGLLNPYHNLSHSNHVKNTIIPNLSGIASKFNKSGFHILLMSLTIISIGIITATSFSNLRVGGKRTIIDEELIGKGLIISIISIGIIYLLISSKDNETK
tara:strand:- start:1319 stop:2293 length:975 start_codon:yes stop_codon:yes gene_type:complete